MNTLTQRYVAAAVVGVPDSQRDDVAAELSASIDDAIDGLVATGLTREAAERQAVQDLGDPAELAERFGGRPRHLIGPEYFRPYWRLLRTLLLVVVPIVGVATLIAQVAAQAAPVGAILSALGTMLQVGVWISFWVTAVFAFLERQHTPIPEDPWTPDDLPDIPDRRISVADTVMGIAWLVVLMWAIVWQRDHWLVTVDGAEVPVLNEQVWTPWLLLALAVLAASIVLEVVKYRTGRWTVSLAVVNTGLNAAFAGIVVGLWGAGDLLTAGVTDLVPQALLTPLPWLIVGIALVDTVSGWWQVIRR